MNLIKKTICAFLAAALLVGGSVTAYGLDILKDSKSRWAVGDEYGGAIGWNDDGSMTIYGKSGIVTYTGCKFLDEEITIKFKASIAAAGNWAAIYLRNNIDASLLASKDDGGGVRAFPWYGKGQPFSVNITSERVSLSQCYADQLQPSGLGIGTVKGQYNPSDGQVHTLTMSCKNISDNQILVTAKYDGIQAFDYTMTASEGHEPMKPEGYLSFACYETGDWLQIMSVEVPDGKVELTADNVTSTPAASSTQSDVSDEVDVTSEYERTTESSGTVKKNDVTDKKQGFDLIWLIVAAVGGLAIGVGSTILVTRIIAGKKVKKTLAKDSEQGND